MYSVFGYVYTKDASGNCLPVSNAAVYPYFRQVDSNSSPSKWALPYYTDANGYYTFTLEDEQFLGINAAYKRGLDEVFIAVVYGGGQTLTSTDLTHASFSVHLLTVNDFNEVNIDLLETRSPLITAYTIPSVVKTNTPISFSETSDIDTSWTLASCGNVDVSQKRTYALVDIFTGHELTQTVYDLGDTQITATPNTSAQYTYTTAGDRNVSITVSEAWGTSTTVSQLVRVEYNQPVVDFTWTPANDVVGNVPVTFTNTTTDLDNRAGIYTYDLIIEDFDVAGNPQTQTYTNLAYTDTITYTFQSAGVKNVTLICYWNDGYIDQQVSITKQVNVVEYSVSIDSITQDITPKDRLTPVNLTASVSGNTEQIQSWAWTLTDYYAINNPNNPSYGVSITDNTAVITGTNNGTAITQITAQHTYQSNDTHVATLIVDYFTGWETKQVQAQYTVSTDAYVATADYTTNPADDLLKFYGNNPITFTDASVDPDNRFISGVFEIDDVDLAGNSNLVLSPSIQKGGTYTYQFQSPSRAPFSAVNGATSNVYNKMVRYTITYDDGWEDTITSSKVRYYEVAPNEVSTAINMQCNVDGVSW